MAYSFRNPSDGIIKHYLETSKIIAVVGLSDREDTTSHRVSKEMQERGYRIIPVNPRVAGGQILGETVYASLQAVSYTHSDAADERSSVDLGGRRIIKKKKKKKKKSGSA